MKLYLSLLSLIGTQLYMYCSFNEKKGGSNQCRSCQKQDGGGPDFLHLSSPSLLPSSQDLFHLIVVVVFLISSITRILTVIILPIITRYCHYDITQTLSGPTIRGFFNCLFYIHFVENFGRQERYVLC